VTRLQILLSSSSATFLKVTPAATNNLQYLEDLYQASFESALYNAQSMLHLPLTYIPNGVLVIDKTANSANLPIGARILTQNHSSVFAVSRLLIPSISHPLPITYTYQHQTYSATFSSFSGLSFAPSFHQATPLPKGIREQTGIGGSSAGLSQALADIQILSRTPVLLPGATAATGTLDESGLISPIAGLSQKFADAAKNGVTNLFYPSGNPPPTIAQAELKIQSYPVKTFAQTLNYICFLSHDTDKFCKIITHAS
jgi:PDZ domain-containing secreted protein